MVTTKAYQTEVMMSPLLGKLSVPFVQLQMTSNRSVYVYVSIVVMFAGGLAMKVTSGADQSSF